jgi:hypothetical protein
MKRFGLLIFLMLISGSSLAETSGEVCKAVYIKTHQPLSYMISAVMQRKDNELVVRLVHGIKQGETPQQAETDFFIEVVRDFPDYVLIDRIINPVTIDNQDCKAWL